MLIPDDISIRGEGELNLHNEYLYVMRKDGHYDRIYKEGIKGELMRINN